MHVLSEHGADILELGVPFTDPEADGPAIQRGSERALANGITLRIACEMVAGFRKSNTTTPVVLMGYLNPILAMGVEEFARLGKASGVDGLIVVNLPPEEADEIAAILAANSIDLILLIAPTTPEDRIRKLAAKGSGFLYYVSIKGITGSDRLDVSDVAHRVAEINAITKLPVAVGFGIKTPQMAAAIAKVADGVVVGSALVDMLGSAQSTEDAFASMRALTSSIKQAIAQG